MLDRLHAIRSVSGKAVIGLAVAATLAMAGCGGSAAGTGTGGTSTNASLTACHITGAELASTVTSKGTATPVGGLSGQKLAVDGSSALQPLLKQAAAEFDTANGTLTTVNAGG